MFLLWLGPENIIIKALLHLVNTIIIMVTSFLDKCGILGKQAIAPWFSAKLAPISGKNSPNITEFISSQ